MFHIKYKLDRSPIHGIGLFAAEFIKAGTLIYNASPVLDMNITQAQFDALHETEKNEIRYWGFWIEAHQVWHVDFDCTKFINHSFDATITQHPDHTEGYLLALRDIQPGEELVQDYLEFETVEDLIARGIEVPDDLLRSKV